MTLPQKVCSAGSRKRCEQCLQHHLHKDCIRHGGNSSHPGVATKKPPWTFSVCKAPQLVLWEQQCYFTVASLCPGVCKRSTNHILLYTSTCQASSPLCPAGSEVMHKWKRRLFNLHLLCLEIRQFIFQLPNLKADYCKVKRFLVPDHLQLHPDPNAYS